ncbi:MAG: tRNA adenosine(34) deaminase TadA [Anaerovoracaceae bacterium]|nr:tRNA adenosine(34) deaminase TadA [Bacillota bacterium]MDY2670496.1 tRNA adenosine(34) deaminase TadA [Anaerovoracaceae bacterium]
MTEQERKSAEVYMAEALRLAREAASQGEVPVGAVIVKEGNIIGRGSNRTVAEKDPTTHAEMKAVQEALKAVGGWRLTGCDMYVTLEPCAMCAGALVHSRIANLYIGTTDPKSGACGSVLDVTGEPKLNHHPVVHKGILQEECAQVLRDFFRELRRK